MKRLIVFQVYLFLIISSSIRCEFSKIKTGDDIPDFNIPGGLRGWQVNATNTGLAGAGVDKNTLPLYTGANPVPAGSTITLQKLVDCDLRNGNISIDRCWIVLNTNPSYSTGSPAGINTVKDSDIEATHFYGSPVSNSDMNKEIIVLRCNIKGGQGLAYMNGPGTIQQCYLHDMISYSDPGAGISNHCDGFTRRGGVGQVNFIDNFLDSYTNPNHTSGTVFLQDNNYFDNILFQGNFFKNGEGNGSAILEKKDAGLGWGFNLIMNNNRFYPANGIQPATDPVSGYGYTCDYTGKGIDIGWGQWTDNYVYNPDAVDAKGALILQPDIRVIHN